MTASRVYHRSGTKWRSLLVMLILANDSYQSVVVVEHYGILPKSLYCAIGIDFVFVTVCYHLEKQSLCHGSSIMLGSME
jgi:hypothetical protein